MKSVKLFKLLVLGGLFLLLLFNGTVAFAQSNNKGIEFTPQTTLGNSEFQAGAKVTIDNSTLGKYIVAIYNYGLGLVAVLSVVMIMYGGWKWIFAGGNASSIQAAKGTITSAIIGLVLALSSYLLLKTINPKLVILDPLPITAPVITISGCPGIITSCDAINDLSIPNDSGTESYTKADGTKVGYADEFKDEAAFRKYVCQPAVYFEKCGLPEGMCYWGTEYSAGDVEGAECVTLLDKECDEGGSSDPKCKVGAIQYYCQSVTSECSLGGAGSLCAADDECRPGTFCDEDEDKCVSVAGQNTDSNLANLAKSIIGSGIYLSDVADCMPESSAKGVIMDISQGSYPLICSPSCTKTSGCTAGGGEYFSSKITLDNRLLQVLLDIKQKADQENKGSFSLTSLTGGKHAATSIHYKGKAADIVPSVTNVSTWDWYKNTLKALGVPTVSCDISGVFQACSNMFNADGTRKSGSHIHLNY